MNANTILAPPIAFLVFLALGLLLDYAGSRLAIERTEDGGFRTTYTGGEEWPEDATFKPEYRLYHVAIGFTVLHIAVLLVATMPIEADVLGLGGAVLGIVFVTFYALLRGGLKP
jgi:NADH:ubiquinone oxidoreductase subunit 3 (subunit A)